MKAQQAQPGLFDQFPVPFRAGSPPQVEAAGKVRPRAGRQARRILQALLMCGAMTREEICRLTGIPTSAACGRLRELECPGCYGPAHAAQEPLVRKAGRRKARSGVRVWVYEITEAGKQVLRGGGLAGHRRRGA